LITRGNTVKNTFRADHNNLGTIAMRFDNHKRINSDWIKFRIREQDKSTWYYEQKYNTDQFNPDYYFTFGFPVIVNSHNKVYEFEIESIQGSIDNSVSLNRNYNHFLAKYSFPKSLLLKEKQLIIPYIKDRLIAYSGYINTIELIKVLLVSTLPILIWLSFTKYLSVLTEIVSKTISMINNNSPNNLTIPIVIFIITTTISGFFSLLGIDLHHDGILFKPALDVASGKMLFRDTFTQYGALTSLIQGLSLMLFGKYLIVLKIVTAVFYGLDSVLLYLISKKILPNFLCLLTLCIWILMAPYFTWTFLIWSSVYALFFQLAAILLLLNSIERKSSDLQLFAGVFTALTFWCRQPVGIFLALSIISFLIIQKKSVTYFIRGNLYVMGTFFVWLIFNSAFYDWFKQSIMFSFYWGQSVSAGFGLSRLLSNLFPGEIMPVSIWSILPVWSVLPIGTILLLIRNLKYKQLVLLSFVSLASWLQYYPMSDIRHLYWAATPMFPLLMKLIYQFFDEYLNHDLRLTKNMIIFASGLVFIGIFYFEVSFRVDQGQKRIASTYVSIEYPTVLRYMLLTPKEADYYSEIDDKIKIYFKNNPHGNVVALGDNAIYLTFDSRIKNIHPMYINLSLANENIYRDYPDIMNRYIELNHPLTVN
jgi:hypothetical protein